MRIKFGFVFDIVQVFHPPFTPTNKFGHLRFEIFFEVFENLKHKFLRQILQP